jgi:hypothetical protein
VATGEQILHPGDAEVHRDLAARPGLVVQDGLFVSLDARQPAEVG